MKKNLESKVVDYVLNVAKRSLWPNSLWGIYQPKVPDIASLDKVCQVNGTSKACKK